MRICLWGGVGLLLCAALLPVRVAAQKFQEPTKEELEMTADPKAPGAPAVFLDREETTDNFNHFVSEYARIKVLTEKGKEWATVEVPYVGGGSPPRIEGRTIHPDGTVVPLTGSADDLLIVKSNTRHLNARVFNLPSVEVGSILEYRWTLPIVERHTSGVTNDMQGLIDSELASSIPYWTVQQEIFIHKERFYYNPLSDLERNVIGNQHITHYVDGEIASYLLFTARLPAGVHLQASPKQDYTLELQDVPAFQAAADAPPENGLRYQVRFYYTPYATAQDYWNSESRRWSKMLDQYAEQTPAIRDAAAQMTAGAGTAEAKARKLYDAVQAMENTDFTRVMSEAERKQKHLRAEGKRADDVLREKSGSGNDLASQYLALARAAGLQADGFKVASRDSRLFDLNYLSLSQLDALLVVLHLDGKDVYLDPGEKLCPFGQVHWSHVLSGGIEQNAAGPSYTPPNLTKDAITVHAADLIVDAGGNVTGTVQVVMNGPAALEWRQMNLRSDSEEVKRRLTESVRVLIPSGLSAEIAGIKGMETGEGYFQATVRVSGALGTVTGRRVLLPAFFFATRGRTQFVSEEHRELPVDLRYAEQVIDDVIYHIPAGYQVESAPQSAQLPWPEHSLLVVKVTTDPAKNTVDVRHTLQRAFVLLDAKEYTSLRDYYQRIAANDQQQVVLAAAAASGN